MQCTRSHALLNALSLCYTYGFTAGSAFDGFFNKFKQYQDELGEGLEKSVR